MTKHTLKIHKRTTLGRAVKKLRSQGLVPANIFGKLLDSLNIQLPVKEFIKLRREVGESALLYLQVEGEKDDRPVIVRQISTHPVSGHLLHVSFNQVNLKEKVTAPVAIIIEGVAPAEKDGLGILVTQLDQITISALPTDIPEKLTVDVSGLTEVGSAVLVSDLLVDRSKVAIQTPTESIVVKIEPLAKEEKEEVPVTAAPEAVTAEGPAPAEGAPAPAPEAKPESSEKKD